MAMIVTAQDPARAGAPDLQLFVAQVAHHDERLTLLASQLAAISRSLDELDRQIAEIRQHVKALELLQPPPARRPWQFDEDRLDNAA